MIKNASIIVGVKLALSVLLFTIAVLTDQPSSPLLLLATIIMVVLMETPQALLSVYLIKKYGSRD